MALASGSYLGPYEIVSPLGTGGMGEVYVAVEAGLQRRVAIKILHDWMVHDADRVRRFVQEARAASSLNHPGIVTIFRIGEADGRHFIAAELVEGETLRQRLARGALSAPEVVAIGQQVASALAVAHQAGIVHRDIKPENLMVRPDGLVKILDFGLAKLTRSDTDVAAPEVSVHGAQTREGAVVGSMRYMSPEQARGMTVDGRSDLFSLGAVLHELATGRPAFGGQSLSDALVAVLTRDPAPLTGAADGPAPELARIVARALQKDPAERYQSAAELAGDLQDLRRRQEAGSTGPRPARSPARSITEADTIFDEIPDPGTPASRVSPRVSRAREWPRFVAHRWLAVAGVLLVLAAVAFWWHSSVTRRSPVLTEKDTILLADFTNHTGDEVFDDTLRQGLAAQLQQSPFLSLFPDTQVRATLALMFRSPDDRVTRGAAGEICQRRGLKAFIAGSIARLDRNYSLTLEAVDGQTGASLALTQVEARGKDEVIRALSRASTELRAKLGESLASIQRFDAPLELTTTSLEALKALSLGYAQTLRGRYIEAVPFIRRAVELDPNFAYAYAILSTVYTNTGQPGLAADYAERGFRLRDRVSELEKLRISAFYYVSVTGELPQAIEVFDLYRHTYPRDFRAGVNLVYALFRLGQFEKAADVGRETLLVNPGLSIAYDNLGGTYEALGRFTEAKEVCTRALEQRLDTTDCHSVLYRIAVLERDTAAMEREIQWARGKEDEDVLVDLQSAAAALRGQWRRSRELTMQAIAGATARAAGELASRYGLDQALRSAALGRCGGVPRDVEGALARAWNPETGTRAILTLALCDRDSEAPRLIHELTVRYPKDTLVNGLWAPTLRAAVALRRGETEEALTLLAPTVRYEAAGESWPGYLRGSALLRRGDATAALVEFRKVVDRRGHAPLSVLRPLAHLGVARAAATAGDRATSRAAYEALLEIWKDADPDLPPVVAARREAAAGS